MHSTDYPNLLPHCSLIYTKNFSFYRQTYFTTDLNLQTPSAKTRPITKCVLLDAAENAVLA